MSMAELLALELPHEVTEARAAVLFMWRLASMQPEALALCQAWGFTVKTELVWNKLTRTGKKHFGMGRYVRMAHEVCLVAAFGKAFPERLNVRSTFEAPVLEHSRKPDAFYEIVEALYPSSRKVELFARVRRPGWVQYGDQVGALT